MNDFTTHPVYKHNVITSYGCINNSSVWHNNSMHMSYERLSNSYGIVMLMLFHDLHSEQYGITRLYLCHADQLVSRPYEIGPIHVYTVAKATVYTYGWISNLSIWCNPTLIISCSLLTKSCVWHICCFYHDVVTHMYDIGMLLLSHPEDLSSHLYVIPLVHLCHTDELISRPYEIIMAWYTTTKSHGWLSQSSVCDTNSISVLSEWLTKSALCLSHIVPIHSCYPILTNSSAWASYQIRNIAGCACT